MSQVDVMADSRAVAYVPLQPASLDIWDSKYRLKNKQGAAVDETVDDTWQRVARALADCESSESHDKWYEKFLWALRHGAIPAGRIVSNAGAAQYKSKTSTINCTVAGTVRDSMDDILTSVHEAGMTLKAGAGVGYEFSTLRPRGAYVSGAGAYTSGPLSFMDIFDKMCFTISSAGGRRGAQMGTFDVSHPDVREFIRAKREDGRLRQFNLSLLITDGFMEAVQTDGDWPLVFPVQNGERGELDLNDPHKVVWREWPVHDGYVAREDGLVACKIYGCVRARSLWNAIMTSTYDYAEPGFLLIDRANEMNNNWWCENIRASNPCVTADAWIHTASGPRQVKDLVGEPFIAMVDGAGHASGRQGFFATGRKRVVKLMTRQGLDLTLTPDHRVRVALDGDASGRVAWRAAGSLSAGDRIVIHNHRGAVAWDGAYAFDHGYVMGLLVGDGYLHKTLGAFLCAWPRAVAVGCAQADACGGIMGAALHSAQKVLHFGPASHGWFQVKGRGEYRLVSRDLARLAGEFGMAAGHKRIGPEVEATSSDFHRGFLRGMFDADGSVQGTQQKGVSVRLAQSDLPGLKIVQRMLLRLGVVSTIYRDRRPALVRMLPNGHGGRSPYDCKRQHELVISGSSLRQFADLVGFADAEKQSRLTAALHSYRRALDRDHFTVEVESITDAGEQDVYDAQVSQAHAFDANGLYVHNCGEQFLPPNGACLLGSVDLTRFVRRPFQADSAFDWQQLGRVVAVFTRMLDDVVDINGLPLPAQREEILNKRRHGMGFLGLGSTLALLGMRYGSPAAVGFTEDVSRLIAVTGWKAALELAREKGPAPVLAQDFTVTAEMLRKRPEMARDNWRVGDTIRGSVLHAKYSRYMQRIAEVEPELVDELAKVGARFTHHTSIAPTGTISLSFGNNASNGIEPSFSHSYSRNVIRHGRKTKEKVHVMSYEFLAYRKLVDPDASPDATEPTHKLPAHFVSASDVTPEQHVDMQAAAQKWMDSSISKTINVPTDYPFEKFKDIYLYAYKQGLKGCTTFRYNPEVFQGVLVKDSDLAATTYHFQLEDGTTVEAKGNEEVRYDGEVHTAANLFDALKEGYYGKF